MELVMVMYITFLSVGAATLLVLVGVIAGKDIYMAFRRYFNKTGCDVYVANLTRTISHYFMTPKDGIFRIKKLPYVTNPEKAMNLTDVERKSVIYYLMKREGRLKGKISKFEIKNKDLVAQHKIAKEDKQRFFIMSQIEHNDTMIKIIKDKLRLKQENYFKDKRPAFFYLEGDPIPKDFYEYFSPLDAKMVDNLVARAISQPPSMKQESDIKFMKMLIMVATGAAVLAAFLAVKNNGALLEICQKVGATCGL